MKKRREEVTAGSRCTPGCSCCHSLDWRVICWFSGVLLVFSIKSVENVLTGKVFQRKLSQLKENPDKPYIATKHPLFKNAIQHGSCSFCSVHFTDPDGISHGRLGQGEPGGGGGAHGGWAMAVPPIRTYYRSLLHHRTPTFWNWPWNFSFAIEGTKKA